MIVVKTQKVNWIKAGAITVYPFVFIHPFLAEHKPTLTHEGVHCEQQKKWALYGLGIGLLLWFFLYSLALPVGWNYFRKKWETEAYKKGEGYTDEKIDEILKDAPYYLWWMK